MRVTLHNPRISLGLAMALALAGCGSGSDGSPTDTPPTTTIPPPAPPPPPPPPPGPSSGYDTAEYRATPAAVSMNALAAYRQGATGAGIKVAVIDSGIDLDNAQFTGRIDPASADTAGNPTLDDVSGHGTAIAEVLAAGRDGVARHGIAFDATLIVFRTDYPGSCASGDCIYSLGAIEEAIDRARLAGARVINLSVIGGNVPTPDMLAAVDRATAAGIVIAICGGNDAGGAPQIWASRIALSPEARGQVVLAGFINGSDNLRGPQAGATAAHFIAARGGSCSEATPVVSGALALLAQGYPNLTGAQLMARLYASARDAGAPGQDAVYGRGIVDLTLAFP